MRRRVLGVAASLAALVAATVAMAGPALAEDDQGAAADAASRSAVRPSVLGAASEEDDAGIAVSIDDLNPRVLTTQDTVVVSGTVTNTSGADLSDPVFDVFMRPSTPVTDEELTAFLSGERWAGQQAGTAQLGRDLAAGASAEFSVTLARADLPLDDSFEWGPRGLTVTAASGDARGQDRTLLVWDSGYDVSPTLMDAVVSWTADTATGAATEQRAALSLAATDGVTLAVDPELFSEEAGEETASSGEGGQSGDAPQSQSASPSASSSPSASASPAPSSSSGDGSRTADRRLVDELLSTAQELIALPRWDADLGALTVGGSPDLMDLALDSRTTFTAALRQESSRRPGGGATVIGDVVWPTTAAFGLQVLQRFQDQTIIAPPGTVAPAEDLSFTSVSRVEVDTGSGETSTSGEADGTVTVLTSQQAISDVLGWDASSEADQLDAEQALTALTAIITREKPNESRTLLAVVPRGTAVDADLVGRVHALLDQRWVNGTTFSAIAASSPTDQGREAIGGAAALDQSTTDAFQAVSDALTQTAALASALKEPEVLTSTIEEAALRMLAAGTSAEERSDGITRLRLETARLLTSVHAEPTSTVNLINKTANFPVPIANDLAWDVTVKVTLLPSDPRLRVTDTQEVTIPAGTTSTVEVPVSAIGSGDIEVGYKVTTPDGHVLDDTQSVTVRMRAGWEDTGTAVIAGLLVVALVAGVARTLGKRMRARRTAPDADAPGTTAATEEGR
jgi:hypothetical protein